MLCQRCNKEEAKVRWMVLSGKPLQEHVQELCIVCFQKASEEEPDTTPIDGRVSRSSDRSRSEQKEDIPKAKKSRKRRSIPELEGCYVKVGHTAIRLVLENGRYRWGSRKIHDSGTFVANQPDKFSCIVELSSELFKDSRKQCRMMRRGKTYTVKEMPN